MIGFPPRVSVVMAAKNYARFLPTAVNSVRAQTHTDWELVIVDDGSTDATAAAVQPFLTDARVRYLRSDRLGQPRAKNLGARLTTADWIAFLDADDAWQPTKLARQLSLAAAHPAAGVIFTLRTLINEAGEPQPGPAPPALPPPGKMLSAVFAKNFICFSSVMIRREVFESVGGFDPNLDLAIDYDLWLRAARHTEFVGVPEPLTVYRTGHGNLSRRLADRVLTADNIMTRALERRGLNAVLPRPLVGEGYASTYRALAHTVSRSDPAAGLRWYWRALIQPGSARRTAFKGLAGCLARLAWPRTRPTGSGENARVNR